MILTFIINWFRVVEKNPDADVIFRVLTAKSTIFQNNLRNHIPDPKTNTKWGSLPIFLNHTSYPYFTVFNMEIKQTENSDLLMILMEFYDGNNQLYST